MNNTRSENSGSENGPTVRDRLLENPNLLDELSPEQFVQAAWWIGGWRGYEILDWKRTRGRRGYRTKAWNLTTELGALLYCHTSKGEMTLDDFRSLRREVSKFTRADLVVVFSRGRLPPAAVMCAALDKAVEPIGRDTALEWLTADRTQLQALTSEYLTIMMQVGSGGLEDLRLGANGLETREFGRVILPSGGGLISNAELSQRLHIPSQYEARLIQTQHFSLEALQKIQRDPRTMHALTPRQFEEFIAELVSQLGFERVELTPRSRDGGKDVIATKYVHNIPIGFYFECKKYTSGNKVQVDTLRSLLGVLAHENRSANVGVLVTTSRFTSGSQQMIASEARLDGKDYEGLVQWMGELGP